MATEARPAADHARDRVELLSTVLLAMAAVATAWASFQAARWNGEQVTTSSEVSGVRIDAARAEGEADTAVEVDVSSFIAWVDARAGGDEALADFYEDRFRDEFRPAFEAWLATDPFTDPDAPSTPFDLAEYQPAAATTAAELDRRAEVLSAEVQRNVQRSTDYTLTVVLFAISLFFAGLSTKLSSDRARNGLLGVGVVVFLCTAAWVATFPVSWSI
jgi:hypothetical protein